MLSCRIRRKVGVGAERFENGSGREKRGVRGARVNKRVRALHTISPMDSLNYTTYPFRDEEPLLPLVKTRPTFNDLGMVLMKEQGVLVFVFTFPSVLCCGPITVFRVVGAVCVREKPDQTTFDAVSDIVQRNQSKCRVVHTRIDVVFIFVEQDPELSYSLCDGGHGRGEKRAVGNLHLLGAQPSCFNGLVLMTAPRRVLPPSTTSSL